MPIAESSSETKQDLKGDYQPPKIPPSADFVNFGPISKALRIPFVDPRGVKWFPETLVQTFTNVPRSALHFRQ